MARWDVRLAKQFKKRDNEEKIGAIVGIVEEIDPLTVSIYNGQGIFSGDKLYVAKECTEYTMQVTVTTGDGTYTGTAKHEGLKKGDRVACVATDDNQKLFLLGVM
jgi:hypothetical protein